MIRRALLAMVATGLVAAPAAEAGVRADAKRLAQLNLKDNRAANGPVNAVLSEFMAEVEDCTAVAPAAAEAEEAHRSVSIFLRTAIARLDALTARSLKRLRAYRTSDRRLRRMARAMVHTSELARVLGEAPPRYCAYFEAWQAAGWAEDFRISPPVRNLTSAEVASLRRDARIVRGELKRMRRLGVSRAAIEALRDGFTGDELFEHLAL